MLLDSIKTLLGAKIQSPYLKIFNKFSVPHANCKCTGLLQFQKLPEATVLSAQYYCLIAKSLWKQDFWNVQTFIWSMKLLHTKSTKKGRRQPNRNFPAASNSPKSCRKSSQELPWELVVPVRRRRCDIEFMCLFDGFNGVLQVRAWGKRWWYRSSRRYFTVTSFPVVKYTMHKHFNALIQ